MGDAKEVLLEWYKGLGIKIIDGEIDVESVRELNMKEEYLYKRPIVITERKKCGRIIKEDDKSELS